MNRGTVIDGTTGKPAAGANVRRIPCVFNTQPFTFPVQQEGPVEIVLGSDHGVVEGRVVNERQDPAVDVRVALVPDAPLLSRGDLYKSATTDITGAYRIPLVPPGDYKVFAWEDSGRSVTEPERSQ